MFDRLLPLAALLVLGLFGCESSSGNKWWQNTVIYEIYPQSFYDSDGNGLGDLKGIEEKADYLSELGVGAVWINPFYQSPLKDNGYDISDFRKIDPRFGTMEDFESLISTLKWQRSIELIMDFVPNHTSDQHEWFQKSVKKEHPYTDYYVWKDPKEWKDGRPTPPNNWESIFAPGQPGSAWQWNDERQQYYYHAFMVEQPDLNFRNPAVIAELKEVMKFWMDKGINGFRVDAVPHLIEDPEWRDEPSGIHIHTQNLPETYKVIEDFRAYLDVYSEENGVDIFFTTEGYAGPEETLRYYGTSPDTPGAHFPFNFLLLTNFNAETGAHGLQNTVKQYMGSLRKDQFPNWVSGNHDWPRIQSRMGASPAVDQLNMLNLLLPGTSTLFMGDEIGMDSYWNLDKGSCPAGVGDDYRTPSRTPFHWSTEKNAGFTTSDKPWVPVNPEYYHSNVATQRKASNNPMTTTHLKNFKKMMELKKLPAFTNRDVKTHVVNDQVFAFTREDAKTLYVILLNLSKSFSDQFDIKSKIPELKKNSMIGSPQIEVRSVNLDEECSYRLACAQKVTSGQWNMPPKSGMVLSFKKMTSNTRERSKRSANRRSFRRGQSFSDSDDNDECNGGCNGGDGCRRNGGGGGGGGGGGNGVWGWNNK